MRVLVTGSRDWQDHLHVHDELTELEMASPTPITVMHGACPTGADAHAKWWAVKNAKFGAINEPHPADWSRGRRAGPDRNAAMVALGADLCLAFIGPCTSPRCKKPGPHYSHGASGCADLAEKAGITTRRSYASLHDPRCQEEDEDSPSRCHPDCPIRVAGLARDHRALLARGESA